MELSSVPFRREQCPLAARAWRGRSSTTSSTAPRAAGSAATTGPGAHALTQLGFVRLSSNAAFTHEATPPREALALLEGMCRHPRHRFIGAQPALTDSGFQHLTGRMQGHRQVTDAYLLSLARCEGLELITFDRRLVALAGDAASAVRLVPPE